MPLMTTYRPQNFDEFFGNDTTVVGITKALEKKDKTHAYLLGGPSGCGKTSLARLIALGLGCSKSEFRELNAANVRGIDTIREVINDSTFAPLVGNVKVYLIDEAHAQTKDAQNALLKFLEDPPPYVYVILATTEPERLLVTIRNRCATFYVNLLSIPELENLINWVLSSEGKTISPEVIARVADAAQGSPRKALVILDQIVDLPPQELLASIDKIHLETYQIIDLCRAISEGKSWSDVSKILKGLEQEPESSRRAILGYLNTVLLGSSGNKAEKTYKVMTEFEHHLYDTGKPGLTLQCYRATLCAK